MLEASLVGVRDQEKERIRALAQRRLFGGEAEVPHVGRFALIRRIGAGAMGVVYAAYDSQLDRKVAIKLLFPGREVPKTLDDDAHATLQSETHGDAEPSAAASARSERIIREAQALARLTHPNVIAVYEVGTHDGAPFVAMEFVDGVTVADWLNESEPSWREILDLYCQAGLGLAAAHEAGLVHRDFKPENVMVAVDGRARVLDFGLARPLGDTNDEGPGNGEHQPDVAALRKLTASGVLAGTPFYMAPEQFEGSAADAKTDQFALCVALYEGLFAQRPFHGDTLTELITAVCSGKVRTVPVGCAVSRWVRQAILRGLATDPGQRWPTVAELVTALRADPAAKWRRGGMVVAGVAALGVGVGGTLWTNEPDVCRAGDEKLADVWDDATRQDAKQAFERLALPHAAQTWDAVSRPLDEYADAWLNGYTEACEATHKDGTQSEDLLDLRMECLDRRLSSLRGMSSALVAADATVVERSALAAARLPEVRDCADTQTLRQPVRPPDDPVTRAAVAQLRADVAEVEVAARLGKHETTVRSLGELEAKARELDYAPALAETLLARGDVLLAAHDYATAKIKVEQGLLQAEAGRHDRAAAKATAVLVLAAGFHEGQRSARAFDALAAAKIKGLGGDEGLDLLRRRHLGTVLGYDGFTPEAAAIFDEILPRAERHYGVESPEFADTAYSAGQALVSAENFSRGIPHLIAAIGSWRSNLSPEHPYLVDAHTQVGRAANALLDPDLALEHLGHAQRIAAAHGSVGHRRLTLMHMRLGEALGLKPGREDESLTELDRAIGIAEAAEAQYVLISALNVKAGLLAKQGRFEESSAVAERALQLAKRYYGSTPELAYSLFAVATAELGRGDYRAALPRFERTRGLLSQRRQDHPVHAHVLTGLGLCELGLSNPEAALELLERAAKVRGEHEAWGSARARTWFALGRALVETGADDEQARELGVKARDQFVQANEPVLIAAVDRWLASLRS